MKKFNLKPFAIGFFLGTLGITSVFAASGLKSARLSTAKIFYNDKEMKLTNPLISVIKDNDPNAHTYMPLREILENLSFDVVWNSKDSSITLVDKTPAKAEFDPKTNALDFFKKYLKIDLSGKDSIIDYEYYPKSDLYYTNMLGVKWEDEDAHYYANMELDGDIVDFGIYYLDDTTDIKLIELEEAKNIANKFITDNNLVKTYGKLTYLGECTIGPEGTDIIYSLDGNKSLKIYVNSSRESVIGFSIVSLQDGKDSIENGNYRETGVFG